jgi:hypothetical protein
VTRSLDQVDDRVGFQNYAFAVNGVEGKVHMVQCYKKKDLSCKII